MNHHPLETIVDHYLAEKDITRSSRALYETVLKQYMSYLQVQHILYAKTSDVINYCKWKRSQGYSVRWMYLQINTIKGLYRYLCDNQKRLGLPVEYATNITETIKNERIRVKISKPILSLKQAKHLILWTKNNRRYIWHYRDHAMIYLMITTGLRSVEVRRAKKKDLGAYQGQNILYVQGKGQNSKDAFVKMPSGVFEAINDYLAKRHDNNPYLFISHSKRLKAPYLSRSFFIRMFRRILKDCGLNNLGLTPHSLRHTAATLNLLRGGSLESTKQMLRHADISSTLIYAHHLDRLKDDAQQQLEHYILKEDPFWQSIMYGWAQNT